MNILFSAYQRKALPGAPEGMTLEQLGVFLEGFLSGRQAWLLIGRVRGGELPVGICITKHTARVAEPHVAWFPWASPRHKLECSVAFLEGITSAWIVLIITDESNWPFFDRLVEYGVVRDVGRIDGMYENGDARVWQTV